MTTVFSAIDFVVKRWLANWTSTTRTALEGEDFKPARSESWVRLSVRHTGSEQSTLGAIGSRRFLRSAEVLIQVFTPANAGTSAGTILAQAAREVFEAMSFDGLRFHGGARVDELGEDGEWLMHLVSCPFDYQEIK